MPEEDPLRGSPYLIEDDEASQTRSRTAFRRAAEVRDSALDAQRRLESRASSLLEPFQVALRSDMVAESNQIEGYAWSPEEVRSIITKYKDQLASPSRRFLEAVQQDAHAYEAVGLYTAQQLADRLAQTEGTLREIDIRQLHSLVTGDVPFAGRYKQVSNQIGGTSHRTTEPWDVPRAMHDLAEWWAGSDADPVLQAAVVHAWLTHVHPFEDGNGRVSRVLANYCLVRSGYPSLVLRSQSDRGQYYDALARSDEGDILPLVELFVAVMRRTVKNMRRASYVREIIDNALLANLSTKYALWLGVAEAFWRAVSAGLGRRGAEAQLQGYPSIDSFDLLCSGDPDGNCWYFKAGDGRHWVVLAFFGFASKQMVEVTSGERFPSIFFSRRDFSPAALHPYSPLWYDDYSLLADEVRFRPAEEKPVQLRNGNDLQSFTIEDAATVVADQLLTALYYYGETGPFASEG